MASSSSSRRKWKVARIARNTNPTGWISDEDIRRKLFSLRKIKAVVSHRYLKLVSVFYSNLKMSDETFCNTVKRVDMKLINEVWIRIVVFQPISKESFLFQIWIGHQGLIGFTMIKTDSTKTKEDEWAIWLCGENRLYVRIVQKDTWDSCKLKADIVIDKRLYGLKNHRSKWKGR
ncbi:hypothetical protein LR48_Vigan07g145700 [Vigna angularis]|uniref:Uncharacterized protein n=1 Tax=Phaseolus angularis TaxID=3914 RepID=A0A0L9UY94_PHAAN|nr:hypothetical protein LR48_Vigan07g145700 [Vigna angularis]